MAKTGQKILVVEDEPDIRKLVNYNLAQERFKVLEAEDGEQGLKIVQRDKPDLVILDLMLPGLSGMELCKILRERSETERLPVLMLTAKAGEADRRIQAPAKRITRKPRRSVMKMPRPLSSARNVPT